MRANSQFPQPDLHRQDTRPYGLRTENTEPTAAPPVTIPLFHLTCFIRALHNGGNSLGGAGGQDRRWVGQGSVCSVDSVAHPGWGGRIENRPFNHLPRNPRKSLSLEPT